MNRIIDLVDVSMTYGKQTVLNHVDLYINQNEFLTLLGPSGCGKTTTLRIIGGFEQPTTGDVLFNGVSILNTPPHKRPLNTIFQRYALFPHLDVAGNIAFGLKIKKASRDAIEKKVAEMLKLVNLEGYEKRNTQSLSGGQQQRVAIARALANEPQVLLLDEPLGALDLQLRKEMQVELKNMQRELGITFVFVTHDQEEALTMSDTIAVMNEGNILQIGRPEDIYNEPKNAFVAKFIGESNVLEGIMRRDFCVSFGGAEFACIDKGFAPDEAVDIVIRPEDVVIVPSEKGRISGRVTQVIFKGVHYEMHVETGGFVWKIHSTVQAPVGDAVGLEIAPDLIHAMKRTTGAAKS
jgi:spermidine/putrescine transport system ATP-binding protein